MQGGLGITDHNLNVGIQVKHITTKSSFVVSSIPQEKLLLAQKAGSTSKVHQV